MNIRAQHDNTSLDLYFDDEVYMGSLSPEGKALAPQMTVEAIGPIVSALAAAFHSGVQSPQHMAIVAQVLGKQLLGTLPLLMAIRERLATGESYDEIMEELIAPPDPNMKTFAQAIDDLDF